MFRDEKDFKKIIDNLNIDDAPNDEHRQTLRRQMLSNFSQATHLNQADANFNTRQF